MTEYDISEAFRRIENDLIESLIRNFSRHRAEETKEGYDWDAWQALQLRELEKYRKNNAHKFDDDFNEINESIRELFNDSADRGEGEASVFFSILDEDYSLPTFGINSERIDALIEATTNDLEKAEHAILRKANDEYRKIIFDAQVYADQGGTYDKAIDMATRDFRKRGITSIVYKNGARHTIEDYASMAIKTGGKRAYLMGLGQQMARIGIHTVIVNRRTGACPFCTPWIGRVLVDDVYNEGTADEARRKGLPLLSEAMDEGFLHPNCKDIYSMYIEGVSKPENPLSEEEKDDLQKIYDLEQEIKKAEGIRESYFRLAMGSLDKAEEQRYLVLNNKWADKIEELKKQLKDLKSGEKVESVDSVPLINHEGIRSPIEIEYERESDKGLFELPDGVLFIDDEILSENERTAMGVTLRREKHSIVLNKQVKLPWDGFGKKMQDSIGYNIPHRRGLPFILQKKDFEGRTIDCGNSYDDYDCVKWFRSNGYEYVGRTTISKYNIPWSLFVARKDGKYFVVVDGELEESVKVSQKTMDAILEREKIVSDALWKRNIRFKNLTSRDGDDWVKAMTEFHTVVEADKPMSLVSRELYDKVKGEELYRGIAPVSNLRKDITMTKTTEECVEQLVKGGIGDCFPSRGIYGDGVAYTSNSTDIGFAYAAPRKNFRERIAGGYIVRFKIKDDAKVILWEDAVKLFDAVNQMYPNEADNPYPYFSTRQRTNRYNPEVGKAMQLLGYDVILHNDGDGTGAKFYVILNRDALVGCIDDYILTKITPAMARRGYL